MMTTNELAAQMNAKSADVAALVACLKVWTDKGYTVEQAIEQHQRVMTNLLASATRLVAGQGEPQDYAFRSLVADQVWEAVNAGR